MNLAFSVFFPSGPNLGARNEALTVCHNPGALLAFTQIPLARRPVARREAFQFQEATTVPQQPRRVLSRNEARHGGICGHGELFHDGLDVGVSHFNAFILEPTIYGFAHSRWN